MGKRCPFTLMSQTKQAEYAEDKILDLIDEAYRLGKDITQPDIEKILSKKPYDFSHTFIYKKLKKLENEKKIRCWQENGTNHFDLPPFIPEPIKLAILVSAIVIGITTILDVVAFGLMGQNQIYMLGTAGESIVKSGMNLYALKCGLFITFGIMISTFLQYLSGMFKESKTKKYLNNNIKQ